MTSSRPVKRFSWKNLGLRAASALVLAPMVGLAIWFAGWAFLVLMAAAIALLAIEWGAMSAPRAPIRVSVAIAVTALAAAFAAFLGHYWLAWVMTAAASLVCGLVARGVAERPEDAAFGAIYISAPAIALIWLRIGSGNPDIPITQWHGWTWTVMLFAITWSADIFAFLVGSVLKGPKLWPKYSPNKTWSGFFGGLAGAVAAGVGAAYWNHNVSLGLAAIMGLIGGLATMGGDLWESMLKRRFGVKDSGDLIPGHGGLLDRVDGLMFAILAVAAARLIVHWGWAA